MKRKLAVICCCALLGSCIPVSAAADISVDEMQTKQQDIPVMEEDTGEGDVSVIPEDTAVTETPEPSVSTTQPVPIDEAHFPDPEFRRYLLEKLDKDQDQAFSEEEIANLKTIAFYEDDDADRDVYRFQNMKGIEYLPALEKIILEDNSSLTELDVSQNPALISLSIEKTKVRELDLSNNPNLEHLTFNGYLEKVTFSQENNLKDLYVFGYAGVERKLSDYDFSRLTKLDTLFCDSFGIFLGDLKLSQLPMLKVLKVSEETDTLDVSKNPLLEDLDVEVNQMKELDFTPNPNLKSLSLKAKNLETLNISNCEKLTGLYLTVPKLTSLDLTGKKSLLNLRLYSGDLGFINVDGCPIEFFDVGQTKSLTLKNSTYYDLAKIPGYNKDRIISVSKANLSGSKLYPTASEATCKYYGDSRKKHVVTCKFTFKSTYIPENVTGLTVTGHTTTSISCKWDKLSGVDGYRLYAKNLSTGKLEKYVTLSKESANKGTVKGLKPGNGYRMVVKAYKKHNDKTYYSEYELDETRLAAANPWKQTLQVKQSDEDEVTFRWNTVNLYGDDSGYLLYGKTSPTGSYKRLALVSKKDAGAGSYAVESDTSKTAYFKMRSYVKVWDKTTEKYVTSYSSYSNEVVLPPRATGLKVSSSGQNFITCKWNQADGVDGYRVYARNVKTNKVEKTITIKKASTTAAKLTGLKENTKYRLIVRTWKRDHGKNCYSDYRVKDTVTASTQKENYIVETIYN